MTAPRPCSPAEAIQRAVSLVGRTEPYVLGTGDYTGHDPDLPFTTNSFGRGSDCWGFAGAWCYKLPRHREGYNRQPKATVADDINCDSAIEQAEHAGAVDKLWEAVDYPKLGDLLVFPSIRGPGGKPRLRIGHVGIVVGLCAEWDPKAPQYGELEVVQCQASRRPAIVRGPGHAWMFRAQFKGLIDEAWRTRILRAIP